MVITINSLGRISDLIRNSRKASKLSQKRLGRMCGLSQSTIARLETDIASLNPSYKTVFQVIDALNSTKTAGSTAILGRKAKEIMHRHIIYVRPSNTIAEAIEIFKDYDFQQLPVLDSRRHVVGTVHQKDLLNIATQDPGVVKRRQVAVVMKGPLPQIDRNTELTQLKPILESTGAVIVVEDGIAIGIVTIYDILKNL